MQRMKETNYRHIRISDKGTFGRIVHWEEMAQTVHWVESSGDGAFRKSVVQTDFVGIFGWGVERSMIGRHAPRGMRSNGRGWWKREAWLEQGNARRM
jgi:hypothetical protein